MKKGIFIIMIAAMLCGKSNLYWQDASVYEVKGDEVIVEVSNGNLYGFYESEWNLGDKCILLMDSKGTEDVTDDEIIVVKRK